MTAPADNSRTGDKHSGGLAQVVRWLTEERPITSGDDAGFVAGAPRRATGWTYGAPPAQQPNPEIESDVLAEVRIGPAPRCAVAGETIALSVSLLNTRGEIYLGWPIKLEWTSSDPSIATVNEFGIVDVHARGRVELTCTCEGISGSVLLTVVEPAVAIAVGLPVPARLRAAAPLPELVAPPVVPAVWLPAEPISPSAEPLPTSPDADSVTSGDETVDRPDEVHEAVAKPTDPRLVDVIDIVTTQPVAAPTTPRSTRDARWSTRPHKPIAHSAALPLPAAEPPAPYRRSVERGSVKRGVLASLPLSRGTRRLLFRAGVGAATGAIVALLLTRSPEDVFFVETELPTAIAGSTRGTAPARQAGARTDVKSAAVSSGPIVAPSVPAPALADTTAGTELSESAGRIVAEAAGSAVLPSETKAPTAVMPAAPAPAPVVSRVVVAASPSQLTEGESVRLSAAGVDERGSAVADRAVTWKSENEDVAVVDPDGVVTAKRAGTVTIVATSEGRAGRVTLSVGARPAPAPSRPEYSPAAAMQVIRARVDEFVTALRERNGSRVASLYNAESAEDRKNLQSLLERLRRPEARLKATDPALGTPEIREVEAAVDFQVAMSWTTAFGRVRNQTSTFRAVLEPGDGGWRLVAIRALAKID